MKHIEIMYCPRCGQGMYIITSRLNDSFKCVNDECSIMLRLHENKDGKTALDEIKEGSL